MQESIPVGRVFVRGTVDPADYSRYELYWSSTRDGVERQITRLENRVVNGILAVWDASSLPPGEYRLRLRVVKADRGNWHAPECMITFRLGNP